MFLLLQHWLQELSWLGNFTIFVYYLVLLVPVAYYMCTCYFHTTNLQQNDPSLVVTWHISWARNITKIVGGGGFAPDPTGKAHLVGFAGWEGGKKKKKKKNNWKRTMRRTALSGISDLESWQPERKTVFTFDTETAIRQVRLTFQDRPVKTKPRWDK